MSKKIITMLFLITVLFSCKKEIMDECPKCPVVTSLHPKEAHFEDTVLILGRNLLPDFNHNDVLEVKFNGKLIPYEYIIDNYDDSIRLIIPKGTESGPVTVDLNVEDELISAGSANFTYLYKHTVSTFAGSGTKGSLNSSDLLNAQFEEMHLMTINPVTNDVLVVDYLSPIFRIRKISPIDGVSTIYSSPDIRTGFACDDGGQIYCKTSESGSCFMKKLIYSNGNWNLTYYAGGNCGYSDGTLTTSQFGVFAFMNFDVAGNLIIGESGRVRQITPSGVVSTISGSSTTGFMDGPASSAKFMFITDLVTDNNGDIFISDRDNYRIRKLSNGIVSTIAGTGNQGYSNGSALSADINPHIVALDNSGILYFADASRHNIRKLNLNTSEISVFAGSADGTTAGYADGDPEVARFNVPYAFAFNKNLNILYVLDRGNFVVRQITFE